MTWSKAQTGASVPAFYSCATTRGEPIGEQRQANEPLTGLLRALFRVGYKTATLGLGRIPLLERHVGG